jgi:primase-polymerase (primpol)-like protein
MTETTTASRTLLALKPEGIDDELKTFDHWIVWKAVPKDADRIDKVPYDPKSGKRASTTDSRTWASFTEALDALEASEGLYAGLGFVFSSGDPFVGLDFDNCRNPETGVVSGQVLEYIRRFEDAYVEASVSGTGVHLITPGKLRGGTKRGKYEIYGQERFFAMTGVLIDA